MSAQRSLLITGCSSGIGLASAELLAGRGWRVLATCRSEADCAALNARGLESFRLDYEDPDSIAEGFETAMERCDGRLDALFNNGAYAIPGMVEDITPAALRANLEANLIGWHDLTRRVLPGMRERGAGRIVQNSSVLGFVPLLYRGAYVTSKYALEGLTDTLRLELRGTGVHVVLIEPGPITSRFNVNAMKQFDRWIDVENSPWKEVYRDRLRYADSTARSPGTLPSAAVAEKLVRALESPRPRPRYYVTWPTYLMGALRRVLSTRALDNVLARRA